MDNKVKELTGWDYSSLEGEEKFLNMIEDLVDKCKELENKLAEIEEDIHEYGIHYPSAEEEICYSRRW